MKNIKENSIKNIKKEENDFSEFFLHASSEEKKKLMLEVVRQANQDQLEVIERYNKMFPQKATQR